MWCIYNLISFSKHYNPKLLGLVMSIQAGKTLYEQGHKCSQCHVSSFMWGPHQLKYEIGVWFSSICLNLTRISCNYAHFHIEVWWKLVVLPFFFFTLSYFQVHLPFYNKQNPKSFLSYSANGACSQLPYWFRHLNIQLPSSSMNAMEF